MKPNNIAERKRRTLRILRSQEIARRLVDCLHQNPNTYYHSDYNEEEQELDDTLVSEGLARREDEYIFITTEGRDALIDYINGDLLAFDVGDDEEDDVEEAGNPYPTVFFEAP